MPLISISKCNVKATFSKTCLTLTALTIVGLAASRPAAAASLYTITDLGTLDGTRSRAIGINNNNVVVGNSTFTPTSANVHAFRHIDGGMLNPATDDLGTLNASSSIAVSINDNNVVVGYSPNTRPGDTTFPHAFLHSGSGMLNPATDDLGTLGGVYSVAIHINNNNVVVGESGITPGDVTADAPHAFRHSGGGSLNPTTDDLGTLGGKSSFALSVNNNDVVVGTSETSSGHTHPFRHSGGGSLNPTTDDLGTLGGEGSALNLARSLGDTANSINKNNVVVGSSETSSGEIHAFRHSGDGKLNPTTDDLGTLGGSDSAALSNNDNDVAVGISSLASGDVHAFVWTASDGMIDLNNLVTNRNGWVLDFARDINDLGQIVGSGMIDGNQHAYVLTPVPEPSNVLGTFAFATCSAAAFVRKNQKNRQKIGKSSR